MRAQISNHERDIRHRFYRVLNRTADDLTFSAAVDAYEVWEAGDPEPTVNIEGSSTPISRVFGLYWNNADKMPGRLRRNVCELAEDIGDVRRGEGSFATYAQGARAMLELIKQA